MAQPAPWPSPGDYTTAIQNPQNCFGDPELRRGRARTSALGLPIGASGNFAVVYQLDGGGRSHAVRCFIRPVTDQQRRYEALGAHLSGFSLPSLVDFAYLPQGIRVRGQGYPVVRMEWVSGKQLHRYVEDNLGQGPALERLAARWRGVVAGLAGAHTAHGDLQHGNVLVDGQGQIRLVDYDGFFLPALRGQAPGEVGHPNYQHPGRIRNGHYEENADAFSALVIYLSLLALRAEPGLFTSFHYGENLIFKAGDFESPGRTPVWGRLRGVRDADVQRLAGGLEGFCRWPVSAVPDLETVLQRMPRKPRAGSGASTPISIPVPRVPPPALAPTAAPPAPPPSPAPPMPGTINCAECGLVNKADEIYCQRCAHPLRGDRPCPHCGHSAPEGSQFCPECGRKL